MFLSLVAVLDALSPLLRLPCRTFCSRFCSPHAHTAVAELRGVVNSLPVMTSRANVPQGNPLLISVPGSALTQSETEKNSLKNSFRRKSAKGGKIWGLVGKESDFCVHFSLPSRLVKILPVHRCTSWWITRGIAFYQRPIGKLIHRLRETGKRRKIPALLAAESSVLFAVRN